MQGRCLNEAGTVSPRRRALNLNYDPDPMAKLRIQFENGDPEKLIEFDPAKAPFHHDGGQAPYST